MYYTIYKITNKLDGKFYIGKHKTKNLDDGYMGSGLLIRKAIEKHGVENFEKEILQVFDTEEEMNKAERRLVVIGEDSYNLCEGGAGGFSFINRHKLNRKCSREELLAQLEKAKVALSVHRQDEKWMEKYRASLSNSLKGRPSTFRGKEHSLETKTRMSLTKRSTGKGVANSQYGTKWITDGLLNKKIRSNEDLPFGWKYGRSKSHY